MRSSASEPPATLSIGELSRRSGVNIETIRYYERIKMVPAPRRTASGRRVYGPAETWSLTFIRRSRELGFSLEEIRALLALSADDGQGTCADVRELAARHLEEVLAKIVDLRAMAHVLSDAVRRCDAGELPRCPLIETLSQAEAANAVHRRAANRLSTNKRNEAAACDNQIITSRNRGE